jgi:hypothetical protein
LATVLAAVLAAGRAVRAGVSCEVVAARGDCPGATVVAGTAAPASVPFTSATPPAYHATNAINPTNARIVESASIFGPAPRAHLNDTGQR